MLSVVLPALILGHSVSAAAEPVVSVELQPVAAGERPVALVRATGEPVHLPACRGLTWQSFDEKSTEYEPIPEPACGPSQPAQRIDKDGTRFRLEADPGSAQAIRAVVVVGVGCTDGRPFPVAGCKAVSALESAPTTLRLAPQE
jgi:hypothetical protein